MSSPKRVRTRNSRSAPFDEERVVSAITEAMVEAGVGDPAAARELTAAVTHFLDLEPSADDTVDVELVHNMIEKVLMETGHREVARSYVLRRERKRRLRERHLVTSDEAQDDFDHAGDVAAALRVGSGSHGVESEWSRSRIATALIKEADMDEEAADEIATAVEERVRRSGRDRISTRLIRGLVDNELFDRGYTVSLDRQASVALPRFDLERLLFGGGAPTRGLFAGRPPQITQSIGQAILRDYLLEQVLGPEVRESLADGTIYLHELEVPLQYLRASLSFSAGEDLPGFGRDPEGVFARLEREVASLFPFVAEEIQVFDLELALSEDRRRRAEADREAQSSQALANGLIEFWQSVHRLREYWPGPVATVNLVIPASPRYVWPQSTGLNLFPASETAEEIALPLLESLYQALASERGREALASGTVTFEVSAKTFEDRRFRDALAALLGRLPQEMNVYFVPVAPDSGSAESRLSEGAQTGGEPESEQRGRPQLIGGKATLNLPRVAWEIRRSGLRPDDDAFSQALQDHLAACLDVARQAIRERARFVARLGIHPAGPLTGGVGEDASKLVDRSTHYVLGILGLDDAVRILSGESLHDGPASVRLGLEITELLAGNLMAGERPDDPPIRMEESANRGSVRRFQDFDRQRFGSEWASAAPVGDEYTSGVRFSRLAPVDPLESWLSVQPYREHVRFLPRLDEVVRLRSEGAEVVFAYLEELCSRVKHVVV